MASSTNNNFSLSGTSKALIRSGFFGKDFETYRSEIIDFLNARFGTQVTSNIITSEQGVMLIEMVAFALSTASWYGDRQADDTTLRDARLRVAAVTIARQLGYKPAASVPPVISLTMTITNPLPLPVVLTIPKGTELTGPGGLTWETAETIIFDPTGPFTKTFPVREGNSLEEIFTSDGSPGQVFELATIPTGMTIAQSSATVLVNSVAWTEVTFLTYNQTNQVEIGYGFDPPRVIFGDGIAGNIPPVDAEIRVQYFVTHGTSAAVASNTVTAFAEPIVAGTAIVTSTLVHNDPSTPGSDPESIEKIKVVAPQVFQAAERAVTLTDLDGWINSFVDPTYGAVAKGRATTPRSVAADAEALTIINQVQSLGDALVALDPSYAGAADSVVTRLQTYWNKVLSSNCKANIVLAQILSADSIGRYVQAPAGLARALEAFLDTIVESTVKSRVTDGSVNLYSVNLTIGVKLLPNYTSPVAQTTVQDTIRNLTQSALIGLDYGVSIRISDLYAAVESVQGVDYTEISVNVTDSSGTDVTATKVNAFGDVPVQEFEVLTMGATPVVNFL